MQMSENPEVVAADYWNKYLEHNHLRVHRSGRGPDTDAGAFLAWMLEAAGDILRESSYTPNASIGYMFEKWHRIHNNLNDNDWGHSLSNQEVMELEEIKKQIQYLPATDDFTVRVKNLLVAISGRFPSEVNRALERLKPLISSSTPTENFKDFSENWRS
jgi:hypothetical protein